VADKPKRKLDSLKAINAEDWLDKSVITNPVT